MAELRHSTSAAAAAARASSSPAKRDSDASAASSPFLASSSSRGRVGDDEDDGKDVRRSSPLLPPHHKHLRLPSELRSLLALEDPRSAAASSSYRILVSLLALLLAAGLFAVLSLWPRLNAPYLCHKEGITLHCPETKEAPSLWENPRAATTSWKPCAERRSNEPSGVPPENENSGYIFIHAEGGLNQQRIAICNAVAIAKIMSATLILPVLKQDQIWKDQTKFEDIFDVDHFINYLKDDVRIVRDIPDWFTEKDELFTSIKRTVKNIPKYASAQFYVDNVLPRIKEKKIMSIKPFVDRLGYDNVPMEINRLRCRVNYHALKFLPHIEEMADKLASRMRNQTGSVNPYMALHLRYEKGMVGLSFCDFAGTREEKAMMAAYRQKEWPRRYKNGSHLWPLALQKRKEGRCPLEPGEIAVILRALGYTSGTQIYVASGQVYGGKNRMAPLRNMFPNLVTKEELASPEELAPFRRHVTSLAALDFLVCLRSDVFVMTHGGNFAKLIIGARRYAGHRLKSVKPDKGLMSKSLGDPDMGWASFAEDVVVAHRTRTGLPEPTFPGYDLWENPLTPCMCRGKGKRVMETFSATDLRDCPVSRLQPWLGISVTEFKKKVAEYHLLASSKPACASTTGSGNATTDDNDDKAAVKNLEQQQSSLQAVVVTCSPESTLGEAVEAAASRHVHRLWVVDDDEKDGTLAGVVSLTDLLRAVREAALREDREVHLHGSIV